MKWILKYLKATSNVCLEFWKSRDGFVGYVDSDFGGDLNKRRSLTCYVLIVGNCPVSWKATLQPTIALSTTKVEYMVAIEAIKEAMWLRGLFNELSRG